MTVELVYCEGWDPGNRSIAHPLPESVARERDAIGEQYAIVLTGGGRPLMLVEICWAAHHVDIWSFDPQGRRDRRLTFRRWPGDRLVLRAAQQWAYDPGSLEFRGDEPEWSAPHWRAVYEPDGSRRVDARNWHGPGLEVPSVHPVPEFGRWSPMAGDVGQVSLSADPPGALGDEPVEPPWRPPLPCRPHLLDETFEKGARFELDDGGEVSVELVAGGRLYLPSGRLVVADPDPWMHEVEPFVEAAPPGTYPLQLSVVRFADAPEHGRVAACALWVSDRPTASWNNAWRAGEQPLLLGDGEFFGVTVDAGRVALVDAAASSAFEDTIEDAYPVAPRWAHELPGPEGVNLITVESGWGVGSYPVWVGRDVDGGLTCFVVDFQVLALARLVG